MRGDPRSAATRGSLHALRIAHPRSRQSPLPEHARRRPESGGAQTGLLPFSRPTYFLSGTQNWLVWEVLENWRRRYLRSVPERLRKTATGCPTRVPPVPWQTHLLLLTNQRVGWSGTAPLGPREHAQSALRLECLPYTRHKPARDPAVLPAQDTRPSCWRNPRQTSRGTGGPSRPPDHSLPTPQHFEASARDTMTPRSVG